MNKEIKARWIEALRSGKYKQGRSFLKIKEGFCCLGVLCELAVEDKIIEPAIRSLSNNDYWTYLGQNKIPPKIIEKWAELDDPTMVELAKMNDNAYRFDEIAKYIEEKL